LGILSNVSSNLTLERSNFQKVYEKVELLKGRTFKRSNFQKVGLKRSKFKKVELLRGRTFKRSNLSVTPFPKLIIRLRVEAKKDEIIFFGVTFDGLMLECPSQSRRVTVVVAVVVVVVVVFTTTLSMTFIPWT